MSDERTVHQIVEEIRQTNVEVQGLKTDAEKAAAARNRKLALELLEKAKTLGERTLTLTKEMNEKVLEIKQMAGVPDDVKGDLDSLLRQLDKVLSRNKG